MKKNKEKYQSMNTEDILRRRKHKIAIISIASLFGLLIIVGSFVMIMKNSGEDTDDNRSTLDILLNRNNDKEESDEYTDYNKLKPEVDKDGNVIKTEAQVAYDENKIVKNNYELFAEDPSMKEEDKKDATVSELKEKINEIKQLLNQYKFASVETNLSGFFKEYKRDSKDAEIQELLTELTNYQLDANTLANIGIVYEDMDYIPHNKSLYADYDLVDDLMLGIQNPLVFLYGHIELPIDYQQANTLDTKNGLYLTAHIHVENLIKIKEVKKVTEEELYRDANYFTNIKNAYRIDFIYDRTPVVATIVQDDKGMKMVGIRLKEEGANNQFYTLQDFKTMDENLKNGKPMFDGIDISSINDYVTGQEASTEDYVQEDYDVQDYGGGI